MREIYLSKYSTINGCILRISCVYRYSSFTDQPEFFYVASIRRDLNPDAPFPSPDLYESFYTYYTSKYGLSITNKTQPLLDVDRTSGR